MSAESPKKKAKLMEHYGVTNFSTVPATAIVQVNQELLRCPRCKDLQSQAKGLYSKNYVLVECAIPQCQMQWFLCIECSGRQRAHITTTQKLRDHISNHRKKRATKRSAQQMQHEQMFSDPDLEGPMFDTDNEPACEGSCEMYNTAQAFGEEVVNSTNLGFDDDHSRLYFQQCFLANSLQAGIDYLVKRSTSRSELEPRDYLLQQLPSNHSDLQMRIAQLAYLLTKGECEMVVRVLEGAYKVGCEDGFACSQDLVKKKVSSMQAKTCNVADVTSLVKATENLMIDYKPDLVKASAYRWSTRVPTSWSQLRSSHLEGSRSIVTNLPIPTVRLDDRGEHSYVSLVDCIRHFLGLRNLSDIALIPNDLIQQDQSIIDHSSVSPRAREILRLCGSPDKTTALYSYILFWSDDVEPNRTKANRGSVWLMTATIATHLKNGHCMEHTFPIAVGKKGDDHGSVVAAVERDMEQLRNGLCPDFYIGRSRKKVKLYFELFATLQDQPERRDFNCLRAGNGSHTGRFGVSADHSAIYKANILPACGQCLQLLENGLQNDQCTWPLPNCMRCVRWDVLDNPNGLARYNPPSDYPTLSKRIVNTPEGKQIKPFRITYKSLKEAVDTAHDQYLNGDWTNQNYESFLEVEGLSTKFIEKAMEQSIRSYSLKLARESPDRYPAIINAAEADPAKYGKVPYPPAWNRPTIGLDLHPDVIMHLLFLGVVKTTILQIQNCLSAQSKLNSFRKSTDGYLQEFQKLHIEWIPIQPYQGERMGGWVSENYLGFSRIMPWFFQNINNAIEMTTDFSPPEGLPPEKWLHRHNQYWLQARGLDSKGKKEELKERIAKYMAAGAPDPLPVPDIPPADVEAVVKSLLEMLRCIMNPRVTPDLVLRTRYAIRVFLSKYDSLTRQLRNKVPPVLSSYNFICLLNIPDAMERFGPLRCIWEGGPRGEGFARFAKPFMTQGFRQNWHHSLLLKLHRAKALEVLLAEQPGTQFLDGVKTDNALRDQRGSFHKYDSVFTLSQYFRAENSIQSRRPVSVVLIELETGQTDLIAVIGDYDHIVPIQMKNTAESPIEHFGFFYFSFSMPQQDVGRIEWKQMAPQIARMGFALLMPLLKEGNYGNYFALISSNWESLRPSITLSKLIV